MVRYFTQDKVFSFKNRKINSEWIKKVISEQSRSAGFSLGDINIIFCSDPFILELNNKYLKHNYFTDIITFDNSQGNLISGDLYISIDTVKSNAKEYSVTFENELHRVIIHGILHLLGYDDKTKDQSNVMKEMENKCLNMRDIG
ncbi:MAG: rRNA maturation RNase YbeY [Ignavibacteria bacterium]|nr:rRNA maturation RNase YbeY [Ignavibacteria bacterium]